MLSVSRDGDTLTIALVGVGAALALGAKRHFKTPFDQSFEKHAKVHELDPNLLRGIAQVESSMNPNAVGPPNLNGTRDVGLMQINEATARALGVPRERLFDPDTSIETGSRLLSSMRAELGSKFSPYTLIASYNAGTPAIKTRGVFNLDYVGKVLYHWQMFAIGAFLK